MKKKNLIKKSRDKLLAISRDNQVDMPKKKKKKKAEERREFRIFSIVYTVTEKLTGRGI